MAIDYLNRLPENKFVHISVAMLQLCAAEVAIPLGIIFRKCVITGIFPDSWKYANVQPVHKKNQLQTDLAPT